MKCVVFAILATKSKIVFMSDTNLFLSKLFFFKKFQNKTKKTCYFFGKIYA